MDCLCAKLLSHAGGSFDILHIAAVVEPARHVDWLGERVVAVHVTQQVAGLSGSITCQLQNTSKLLLQTGETGASALALMRIGARQWKVHLQPVMQVDQSDPSDLSGRKEPATTATWTPELRYAPGQEPKQ